ncbi:hypothetical protein LY625_02250 [Lysobacter sp. GX 14042]|uniref:hypothetical protein n=1 Tax=Lysobacter sp. GX 14042 TaxID=2907155 RepID=UPI001F17C022|nr:hypothetical protein [Lysobacter sp. GX 14042]MCE7031456.1 hypothetical protein [Lysobacter sp. GX 14042]
MPPAGSVGILLAGCLALYICQLASRRPMLDMSLFAKPEIRAGVLMGLVVMGALAGIELTLAQELQFVLEKTPLEAGMFMLPLMWPGSRSCRRGTGRGCNSGSDRRLPARAFSPERGVLRFLIRYS